jgi:hypothetical protein
MAHRFVFGGIGLHLGAIECYEDQAHMPDSWQKRRTCTNSPLSALRLRRRNSLMRL